MKRIFRLLPLRNIPFKIVTKYLAGMKYVIIWRGFGMFEMLNMKPDSKKAGRKEVMSAA
jgi:hypothetical protein